MISTKKLCYKIVQKISSLSTSVGTNTSNISTLTSTVNGLSSTVSGLSSTVSSLNTKSTATTDYVVAQGSGYRKWNSGAAECWGTATNTSSGNCSVTFPFTFTAVPTLTATAHYYNSSAPYVAPTVSVQPSTTGTNFYLRCSTSIVTQGHTISYHAIGTWK